ncbi:MAG: hypothetical protein ACK4JY_03670 [Brevundimonas sp.]|uniref:hypothetical protein n=1 Tax=Brevundimonas sp. TaxID=1871086 RepID=UPI00391DB11C
MTICDHDGNVVFSVEQFAALSSRLDAIETAISNGTFAYASSLQCVHAEVNAARGGAPSLNARLNTVQTDINGKASAASVATLQHAIRP